MNAEVKTTLVLNARDRAVPGVRGAQRRWRLATRIGGVARAAVPLLGLMLATLMCPAPALAAAYSASGWLDQEFYEPGPPGGGSVSPTKATFQQQYVSGDLNLVSNALSTGGNLSLFTLASINNMTNWASGHVWSNAYAGIVEPVDPYWEDWADFGTTFIFEYAVGVSGSLYATSAGVGAAGSQASLGYDYHIGDSSGAGHWSRDSEGHVSKSGTWNATIISSFTVHADSSFDLNLSASAETFGGKTYVPWSDTTVVAMADFSHTMTWLGITGVRAFDSLGNEVFLPSDARLPLIGRESGFDYWYGATLVPEPSTALLLGAGSIIVAVWVRKSAARARNS
jgi:hypothetical protein